MTRRPAAFALQCAVALLTVAGSVRGQAPPAPLDGKLTPAARAQQHLRGRHAEAEALDRAKRQQAAMASEPRAANLSPAWTAVGPGQVASSLYGNVTGRVTSLVLDAADATGNTLYVGTTGGGVWKSGNAAGTSPTFAPLTDTLPVYAASSAQATVPSLSIGALALANGVLLAGTGDPNDATDSYYGAGLLRSADGGLTWTLVQKTSDGAAGSRSFFGVGFAGLAFSSANPAVAVAAVTQAFEGTLVAAPSSSAAIGLYYSTDAGVTWHTATVMDGTQVEQGAGYSGGSSATAVVWNPQRQRFYAAVQFHGYYESADGVTWTRLANQPGAGLTQAACPTISPSAGCPIFRGALAVQPASGDMFALTVDAGNVDTGLYQDACVATGNACASATALFGTKLGSTALEGTGGVIAQGDYNLTLAAAPLGTDTVLYAGTVDLYRCTLAGGCTLRNTTNAQNGCLNRAGVFPSQHALAALGALLYIGNDGGVYRSNDAVAEAGAACSLSDASHFQNLNGGLGSLAEVAGFAQDPTLPGTLMAGLGALGTAGTGAASLPWPQLATGEGGAVAIDPGTSANWYLATAAGVNIARCTKGSGCAPADFAATVGPTQVAGDPAAVHAAWLLDPALPANMLVGTCRAWRGSALGGGLWSSSNAIAAPFSTPAATACAGTAPVVRSLGVGGPVSSAAAAQNAGSEALYAGLAGAQDGGGTLGGHVFQTTAANLAKNTTAWTDLAKSPVTNDLVSAGVFNPGGFDVSSVAVDPHDATGGTVYVTVMGFASGTVSAPHLYRSTDFGAHWLNVSSNLPDAPANSAVVDPNDANTVYLATDAGVYVTTTITTCATTNCWSGYGTGLPNAPVVELQAAAAMPTGDGRTGELRAATYGRGIWQVPLLTAIAPAAPAITLAPTSLTFPSQQAATASAAMPVTVTNTGTAALTVSSVTTTGDYTETDNCQAGAIAVGASCTVEVVFAPTAAGTRMGVLTVYGNVAGGQATAALTGTATAAASVVLTPLSLSFAATTVGAISAVENITIANTGGSSATLQTPVVAGDFQLAANTCTGALAPQTSCTVSIAFAPAASGARSGTLTVNDSAGTQVASLTGTGTTPATDALSPVSLAFATQQLTTASASQTVTLTNAGDVALTLIAAQIAAGDFTVTSACGVSLPAHSSCTFAVAFVPRSLGLQSGTLTISDQFRSQTVALTGTGIAPPGVSIAPLGGLGFGVVGVGLTTPVQTVTLTNNGGVSLTLAGVAATGDFSIAPGGNGCPATLAPAAVCTVQVLFTPAAVGPRSGSLAFTDNAASSPQALSLTGTGADFSLSVNGPASASITSGQTATYGLYLTSAATVPGTVPFTCSGVPAHSLCTVNPSTGALGGTSSVSVTIATGLATAAAEPPTLPWMSRPGVWLAGLLPLLFFRRKHAGRKGRLRRGLVFAMLLAAVGCSTPRTQPSTGISAAATTPTPSGTYTILVAGSSAGLVRSVNLTLIVQ